MGLVTRSWPTVSKRPPTCVPPLGCGGRVELLGAEPDALLPVTELLERSGCILRPTERGLLLQSDGRLHTPGPVVTRPHPGFPTDAQAPMMAALLRAAGITEFTETIFENRLRHVEQLRCWGPISASMAAGHWSGGWPTCTAAFLEATDLRCGAALLIGALQAGRGQHRSGHPPYPAGL